MSQSRILKILCQDNAWPSWRPEATHELSHLHLHPLEANTIAVGSTYIPHPRRPISYHTQYAHDQRFERHSRWMITDTKYSIKILVNGLAVHDCGTLGSTLSIPSYPPYPHSQISFIQANHGFLPFTGKLTPQLVALVTDTKDKLKFVCGSQDRKSLVFFDVCYSYPFSVHVSSSYPFSMRETKQIHFKNGMDWQTITYAFKVKNANEEIISVTSFPDEKNNMVAIALNTGEIKIGKIRQIKFGDIHNVHFHQQLQLETPKENFSSCILLASESENLLIGYYPGNNLLRIWDRNNNFSFIDQTNLPFLNRLQLSTSGKYLTASATHAETANQAYIIQLKPFKFETLTFDEPISDLVIGANNNVCIAENNTIHYLGNVTGFLEKYYQAALALKDDSVVLEKKSGAQPKPNPVNSIPDIPPQASNIKGIGFFNKKPLQVAQPQRKACKNKVDRYGQFTARVHAKQNLIREERDLLKNSF